MKIFGMGGKEIGSAVAAIGLLGSVAGVGKFGIDLYQEFQERTALREDFLAQSYDGPSFQTNGDLQEAYDVQTGALAQYIEENRTTDSDEPIKDLNGVIYGLVVYVGGNLIKKRGK